MSSSTPRAASPREADAAGRFVRQQSAFREIVEERPEPGRYHLYVSLACPWASRAVIVRKLRGLEELVPMTNVDPVRDERGWRFSDDAPDPVNGFEYLSAAYRATDPGYDMRVTVPVLWDVHERRIVNNESADVIRMLNAWATEGPDFYPEALRPEIEEVNDRVYNGVNDAVYQAGFASSQAAYEEAFDRLFATLDGLEERLGARRYLVGDAITLADWRLFTTLVRFDAVYVLHFKCNLRRIVDYPNLSGYLRDLYQHPGVAETVDMDQIKRHYYLTHGQINPKRIVPKGPELDFWAPHDRQRLSRAATMGA